jgi:(5-formylfuran-3-yl)methyl phosphate synthase
MFQPAAHGTLSRAMGSCAVGSRLLVSVRNVREAAVVLDAGVDLLDVKDPAAGSLGMPSAAVLSEIVDCWRAVTTRPRPSLSVALGEVVDWGADAVERAPVDVGDLAYLKLGTRSLCAAGPRFSDWSDRLQNAWAEVERFVESSLRPGVRPAGPGPCAVTRPGRILVAYAEEGQVGAPSLDEALALAESQHWDGLLIDTCLKSGRGLLTWQTPARLMELASRCREAGLLFGLAGQVAARDLPQLVAVGADVIGIRSAACRQGERNAEIDFRELSSFKQALRQTLDRTYGPVTQVVSRTSVAEPGTSCSTKAVSSP